MTDNRNTAHAALLLRLSLGILFLAHGLMKVFVFTPAGTAVPLSSTVPGVMT